MFTLTINTKNNEAKLYEFNSSYDFVIKSSKKGKEKQFGLTRTISSLYDLQAFLGWNISLDDIIVDAVDFENDTYWLVLDGSEPENALKLLHVLLKKFEIEEAEFLHWAGYLNNCELTTLEECIQKKCIAGIRMSLYQNRLKIYARSFKYNSFNLSSSIRKQFLNLLKIDNLILKDLLIAGGVSYDFSDGRVLVYTQNDSLKKLN